MIIFMIIYGTIKNTSLHVDVLTKNLKETLTLPFLFLLYFSLKCYNPCHDDSHTLSNQLWQMAHSPSSRFFLLQIQSYKERKSLLSEFTELNEQSYMSLYKLTADDVEENIDGLTNKNTGTGEGTTILSYSVWLPFFHEFRVIIIFTHLKHWTIL